MQPNDRIFAVLFEDRPGASDLRARHIAAHLDFLDDTPAITSAGPLFDADGLAGGMWLVVAEDASAVGALVEADPFWPTGLRASVRILEWRRVHAEGRRTAFRP
jgi:uncharacterized protein YciI